MLKCPRCGSTKLSKREDRWECDECGYSVNEIGYTSRELLRAARDSGIGDKEYAPTVDFERGVRYLEAERVTEATSAATLHSLEELEKRGLLVAEIWDNLVVCPRCGSHKLFIQLRCPSCGSGKLVRKSTIQHLSCGHYGLEEEFAVGDRLVCPKCNKILKALGVDYRRPGKVYKCLNCGALTPTPNFKFACINQHEFYNEEFDLKEVKLYRLNPARGVEIGELVFDVKSAVSILARYGLHAKAPVILHGESGVGVNLSFAAWADEGEERAGKPPLLIGEILIREEPIGVEPVFALNAISLDLGSKLTVILAVPGLNEEARRLAKSYGMHVLEAPTVDLLNDKLGEFFESIIRTLKWSKEPKIR